MSKDGQDKQPDMGAGEQLLAVLQVLEARKPRRGFFRAAVSWLRGLPQRLKPDYTGLGYLFWHYGRWPQAKAAFLRAAARAPGDPRNWMDIGSISHETGDYKTAADAYHRATLLKPDNSVAWNNMGVALSESGDDEGAEQAYRRALEIEDDSPVIWENLMTVATDSHSYAGAGAAYRKMNAGSWDDAVAALDGPVIEDGVSPAKKPVMFSATVDLKLTPEGEIRICEFNDLWTSGFTGFAQATRRDMKRGYVVPYYRAQAKEWKKQRQPWRDIQKPVTRPGLAFFAAATAARREGTIYANADPGLEAACIFKDYTALCAPPQAQKFFPRTLVLPLTGGDNAAARIADAFASDERVVLKPSDSFQGKGVEVMKASDLPARLAEIAAAYAADVEAPGGDYWGRNLHPNLVVQEYAPSVAVQAADGRWYNGTMRVAFTALLDPQGLAPPQLAFHGAYWKLPAQDISAGDTHESIVSDCHPKLKDKANAAFAGRPVSAPVSAAHEKIAVAQLRECLSSFLPGAAATPEKLFEKTCGLLDSEQEWQRALGTRLATHSTFGSLMVLMQDGAENGAAAKTLREKLARNEAAHDAGAVLTRRLRAAANDNNISSLRQLAASSSCAPYLIPAVK